MADADGVACAGAFERLALAQAETHVSAHAAKRRQLTLRPRATRRQSIDI
jgi:hypothetical protein